MKYLLLTLTSLLAISAWASNDDIAHDIYREFQKGQIPAVKENETRYYSGRCYVFDAGIDPTANAWGIVGVSKTSGAYFTRFWTLITDNHDQNQEDPFKRMSLEEVKSRFATNKKAYPADDNRNLETLLVENPKVYYSVAESKTDPILYLVAAVRGDTYCKFQRLY